MTAKYVLRLLNAFFQFVTFGTVPDWPMCQCAMAQRPPEPSSGGALAHETLFFSLIPYTCDSSIQLNKSKIRICQRLVDCSVQMTDSAR